MWLAVRAKAHLKVLLLFLFAFEADRQLLDPSVVRKGLLVFGGGLLDLFDTLLELMILALAGQMPIAPDKTNSRAVNPRRVVFFIGILSGFCQRFGFIWEESSSSSFCMALFRFFCFFPD